MASNLKYRVQMRFWGVWISLSVALAITACGGGRKPVQDGQFELETQAANDTTSAPSNRWAWEAKLASSALLDIHSTFLQALTPTVPAARCARVTQRGAPPLTQASVDIVWDCTRSTDPSTSLVYKNVDQYRYEDWVSRTDTSMQVVSDFRTLQVQNLGRLNNALALQNALDQTFTYIHSLRFTRKAQSNQGITYEFEAEGQAQARTVPSHTAALRSWRWTGTGELTVASNGRLYTYSNVKIDSSINLGAVASMTVSAQRLQFQSNCVRPEGTGNVSRQSIGTNPLNRAINFSRSQIQIAGVNQSAPTESNCLANSMPFHASFLRSARAISALPSTPAPQPSARPATPIPQPFEELGAND